MLCGHGLHEHSPFLKWPFSGFLSDCIFLFLSQSFRVVNMHEPVCNPVEARVGCLGILL